TGVAIQSADVVPMALGLVRHPLGMTVGRGALRRMRQNLARVVGYNANALPIAAGVFAPVCLGHRPEVAALS
ncbi:MAG: hypothetical protein ACLGI3_13035, partial [Actinomycetes bacterium]